MNLKSVFCAIALTASLLSSVAATLLTVDVASPSAEIQPTMYGLFFEDINFAADGGLYAELVKNRSFEFPQTLTGWDTFGKIQLRDDGPFPRNPKYVRLLPAGHRDKYTGLDNLGYFGIGVKEGDQYRFSVTARATSPGDSALIRVMLVDPASQGSTQVLADSYLKITGDSWQPYSVTLSPSATCAKARLRIMLCKPETAVDLEHISLFPADTWQGRENGLRRDLATLLADLRPGMLRFPGGCIVEGADPSSRYKWKETVGPVQNRPLNENRWQSAFPDRLYPDYYQSGGLGFYEYFLLAEDIGAQPLPILNVGLVCQFQNDLADQIPLDSLDIFIQDAIDLVEFANGDHSTPWGAVRAAMGHPEPFGMKYIGIGNEQWGPEYIERLEPFLEKFRRACPDIRVVGSSGPDSEGAQFEYLWPEMTRLGVDFVDEHYYRPESWFLSAADRYDSYDRNRPKVFAGEYACHGDGKKFNHFNAALLEAAFMTGLERNADVVYMASYAPLLAHVEGWQWRPDMIWFDNLNAVPTSSYYVQKLFSTNRGTHSLPITSDGQPLIGGPDQNNLFASAATDLKDNTIIVKIVNTGSESQPVTLDFQGLGNDTHLNGGRSITLSSDDPLAENTPDQPDQIHPVEIPIEVTGTTYTTTLPPATLQVLIFNR